MHSFYLHRAMVDENSTDEERISLLRKTCSEHAVMYKDAMNGKGIDRHMFGLYVVSKGLGYVSTIALRTYKVLDSQRLQLNAGAIVAASE